jgi:hypothetical protein
VSPNTSPEGRNRSNFQNIFCMEQTYQIKEKDLEPSDIMCNTPYQNPLEINFISSGKLIPEI